MNTILRSLIVWLVLLAVPFQGFASAAMLACGAGHGAATAPDITATAGIGHASHDAHAARGAAALHAGHAALQTDGALAGAHAAAHPDQHAGASDGGHGTHSCSACSTCSIGAAIVPPAPAAVPVHAAPALTVPFSEGAPPSVHLALPERPPRPLRA